MRPFDYEEYVSNPDIEIYTRDGKRAKIIYTGKDTAMGVLVTDKDGNDTPNWYDYGGYILGGDYNSPNDLMFTEDRCDSCGGTMVSLTNISSWLRQNIIAYLKLDMHESAILPSVNIDELISDMEEYFGDE